MSLSQAARWGILCLGCCSVSIAHAQQEATDTSPIPTRQTAFAIPFSTPQPQVNAAEVRLYISDDLGRNWKKYASALPEAGKFDFKAERDGEYWFASQTIKKDEHPLPPGPLQPELRVLVDTTPPQVDLQGKTGNAGEVAVVWNAYDANLAANTIRLEYRIGSEGEWQPVAIESAGQQDNSARQSGDATWWPDGAAKVIDIRITARDSAGNATVVNKRVLRSRIASREPGMPVAPGLTNNNDSWKPPETSTGGGIDAPPAKPEPRSWASFANTRRPEEETTSRENSAPETGEVWPSDGVSNRPPQFNEGGVRPVPPANTNGPSGWPAPNFPSNTSDPLAEPRRPFPSEVQPPVGNRYTSDYDLGPVNDPPVAFESALPVGETPRMTNLRRFELDYDVSSVGPAGVAKVELWISKDVGKSWQRYGEDVDRTSPFPISVDREGLYGFRIVIVSGSGLASPTPIPGDLADLWVGVDLTKPTGRLVSAIYGEGERAGQLDIRWEADDRRLPERPITLKYSDSEQGPWTTIAAGLPNSGQYHWQVDPVVPRKIYLRLEVQDGAGNMTTHQLAEPLLVEGLAPKAHIRGLRPIQNPDPSAYRAPWQR